MKKTKYDIKKYIYLFVYITFIIINFVFSLQNSTDSSESSSKVTVIFMKIVEILSFNFIKMEYELSHYLVRKLLGHFGMSFITSIFGYLTLVSFNKNVKKAFILNVIIGIFVTTSSEILQLFTKNRYFSIGDIIVNYVGYLDANIIALLIFIIRKKYKEFISK